jgi:hypothetical protein
MTKRTKSAKIYRQGDVWIYAIPSGRVGAGIRAAQPPTKKGLILAAGEVTGHHHRIPVEEMERAFLYATANPGVRLLQVRSKPVSLVHEEHETLLLPPGEYEVRIQREYEPKAPRRQTYVRD